MRKGSTLLRYDYFDGGSMAVQCEQPAIRGFLAPKPAIEFFQKTRWPAGVCGGGQGQSFHAVFLRPSRRTQLLSILTLRIANNHSISGGHGSPKRSARRCGARGAAAFGRSRKVRRAGGQSVARAAASYAHCTLSLFIHLSIALSVRRATFFL
jgi:hypothetical protein